MKKTIALTALLAATAFTTCAVAKPEAPENKTHYEGEKLAKKAKLTIDEAEDIALKARPGVVVDRELEKEKGGSGLRYSFDIKSEGVTYEVGVDAKTGDVLENAAEGAHKD